MLPIYIVSKYNIRPSSGVLSQWLNISMRLCSSSDSSDSSDSDSDTEKVKQRNLAKSKLSSAGSTNPTIPDSKDNLGSFLNNMIKTKTLKTIKDTPAISSTEMKSTTTTIAGTGSIDLNDFVNNMLKARKLEKTIKVAIQPKKEMSRKIKPMSYENRLVKAAEDVADKLGGNKAEITSDLLQKFYKDKTEVRKKDEQLKSHTNSAKNDVNLMEYIKSKQYARSEQLLKDKKQIEEDTSKRHSEKKSVIQALLQDYQKQAKTSVQQYARSEQLSKDKKQIEEDTSKRHSKKKSVVQVLLQDYKKQAKTSVQQSQNYMKKSASKQDINLWNGAPSKIFENIGDVLPDMPELKTWAALEQRELKALTTYTPANIFQEMILWTEQEKLWKFPIDNEQGMEEQNIHFSEHVFTERYLKGWCPTSGPVRHFMELVCVGLSKNPYMTIQEKINHIMWYKDYFQSKEELLQELGVINEPFPDTAKQITQQKSTMPKNKGKGGKNRRRGKNENETEKRELVFKEDGQEYAQVTKMLGNGRLEAMCFDGVKRLCHIRGKLRKKVWINQGDIILIGLRDYQDAKADVILKYTSDEARNLKTYGEFPETVRINDTVTFVEDGLDEDIEFGDEISNDDEDDVDNI
ncbi:uncharacterized protein LOC116841909 [Odontomachus brunneus]|nr:uncharacterized protein LOC116841909 [Odontomachus brunneus]